MRGNSHDALRKAPVTSGDVCHCVFWLENPTVDPSAHLSRTPLTYWALDSTQAPAQSRGAIMLLGGGVRSPSLASPFVIPRFANPSGPSRP